MLSGWTINTFRVWWCQRRCIFQLPEPFMTWYGFPEQQWGREPLAVSLAVSSVFLQFCIGVKQQRASPNSPRETGFLLTGIVPGNAYKLSPSVKGILKWVDYDSRLFKVRKLGKREPLARSQFFFSLVLDLNNKELLQRALEEVESYWPEGLLLLYGRPLFSSR